MPTTRLPLSIVVSLSLAATMASAEERSTTDAAKRAFDEGMALEKVGDYENALARFRDAARIKLTPGVRFHEGYCLEMIGRDVQALETYEAAERLSREQGKTDVLTAVRTRLEPLSVRVPRILVRVDPKTADVRLDDAPIGEGSIDGEPLRLALGEHEIVAHAVGYAPKLLRFTLAQGGTQRITLVLSPAEPPATRVAPEPRAQRGEDRVVLPLVVTCGALTAAAAGFAAFAAAGSAQSDAERECPRQMSCESEQRDIRTLDALALTGFVSAAALGALAVVLWSSRGASRPARATSLVEIGRF